MAVLSKRFTQTQTLKYLCLNVGSVVLPIDPQPLSSANGDVRIRLDQQQMNEASVFAYRCAVTAKPLVRRGHL